MINLADINFADLLPSSIAGDEQFQASASVLNEQLSAVTAAIPQVLIYSRINELEEPLLSLLAWQFHVDHWEPEWSLETKREAVKTSIKLHKKKGTPWAVRKAIEVATGAPAEVLEWQDYGGDPYKFKVSTEVTANEETYLSIVSAVNSAKNVRSHLDAVVFKSVLKKEIYTGGKVITGDIHNIPHRFEIKVNPIQTYAGAGLTQADIINIGIRESEITISPVALNMGIAMQQVDITSIPTREV